MSAITSNWTSFYKKKASEFSQGYSRGHAWKEKKISHANCACNTQVERVWESFFPSHPPPTQVFSAPAWCDTHQLSFFSIGDGRKGTGFRIPGNSLTEMHTTWSARFNLTASSSAQTCLLRPSRYTAGGESVFLSEICAVWGTLRESLWKTKFYRGSFSNDSQLNPNR